MYGFSPVTPITTLHTSLQIEGVLWAQGLSVKTAICTRK